MDITVDQLTDIFRPSQNKNSSTPSMRLGVVTEAHLDKGFILAAMDSTHSIVRATAFCAAKEGERVLLAVLPNGQCFALGTKGSNHSFDEQTYTLNRSDGVTIKARVRVWTSGFVEEWIDCSGWKANITSDWGSWKESDKGFSVAYPVLFKEAPSLQVSFTSDNFSGIIENFSVSEYANPEAISPTYYLVRPNEASDVSGTWHIYASGEGAE